MHVYQTPEAVTVYKMLFNDMYVLLVLRQESQADRARRS